MLGEKSLAGQSSLFLREKVWTILTTLSQLNAAHFRRYWGSDMWGAVFRSIDDLLACLCMGRYLCLEPILPVAMPVAVLWRSTCKPYWVKFGWREGKKGTLRERERERERGGGGVRKKGMKRVWRKRSWTQRRFSPSLLLTEVLNRESNDSSELWTWQHRFRVLVVPVELAYARSASSRRRANASSRLLNCADSLFANWNGREFPTSYVFNF